MGSQVPAITSFCRTGGPRRRATRRSHGRVRPWPVGKHAAGPLQTGPARSHARTTSRNSPRLDRTHDHARELARCDRSHPEALPMVRPLCRHSARSPDRSPRRLVVSRNARLASGPPQRRARCGACGCPAPRPPLAALVGQQSALAARMPRTPVIRPYLGAAWGEPGEAQTPAVTGDLGPSRPMMGLPLHTREVAGSNPAAPITRGQPDDVGWDEPRASRTISDQAWLGEIEASGRAGGRIAFARRTRAAAVSGDGELPVLDHRPGGAGPGAVVLNRAGFDAGDACGVVGVVVGHGGNLLAVDRRGQRGAANGEG